MILIISYDLRTPKDYHLFYETIKAQSAQGKWWHYMASTWLLSTSRTPQEVVDALRPHMDSQDFLFVCELTGNYQGYLPKPAWDWLNVELPRTNYLSALAGMAALGSPFTPPPPGYDNPFGEYLGGGEKKTTLSGLAGLLGGAGSPEKKDDPYTELLGGLFGDKAKEKKDNR
jgi:hypothetical protein